MPTHIRDAQSEDIPAVMRLYHFLSDTYRDNPDAVQAALDSPCTQVFVLEVDSKIVGTATLSVRVVPSAGVVGYIDDVVVDPEMRGRGFGRRLSQHCLDVAAKGAFIRVELTSHPAREAANELYKSMGFNLRETNNYALPLEIK